MAVRESLASNQLFKVEMKCRCIDKDFKTIADALDVIERYEAILGEGGKKRTTVRALEVARADGNNNTTTNLKSLQDRIAKLEREWQSHSHKEYEKMLHL